MSSSPAKLRAVYFGIFLSLLETSMPMARLISLSERMGIPPQSAALIIFYNDGSIPTTAATADVIITGETTSNYFGRFLTSGDFNADGKIDLAVGALLYSTNTGRAYIFYNDGSIPTTAATADVIITGETTGDISLELYSLETSMPMARLIWLSERMGIQASDRSYLSLLQRRFHPDNCCHC
jgi:hypothetical protein